MTDVSPLIHVRDPIHGAIRLSPAELEVVDSPAYQRLRGIKQLGFTDLSFPGATHTRYAHALGATEMAGRMFDAIFPQEGSPLANADRQRLRQMVRLAMLLHDIGHAPMSHAAEFAMPPRRALDLSCYDGQDAAAQATHEDYTVKLILDSELRATLERLYRGQGIDPEDICHLITRRFSARADSFRIGDVDYLPLLGQMVSGELDADRMDYLQRDSYYAGVTYGQFDELWLLNNLTYHLEGGRAYLALSHRAVFAFEDFLLSRYHMFVSVYYHHTTVAFDRMFEHYIRDAPGEIVIPADSAGYLAFDDVALWSALRQSSNHWAKRIVGRKAYRRLLELNAEEAQVDLAALKRAFERAEIDYFDSDSKGVLSKYYGARGADTRIFVVNQTLGRVEPVETYAKVFQRYAQPTRLIRLYCDPARVDDARRLLDQVPLDSQPALPL
jgi:HD superfamily phosphohydrolase